MHCVRTDSRHNYRVKGGKHLPWHSVNQYFARQDWNAVTHGVCLFSFSVSLRETRDEGWRTISSATCQCQTLKPGTCCLWHWNEPFPLPSQREQRDKGHPFPSHPFFIALSQLWISISVTFQNASSSSLASSIYSRLHSGPCHLRWQWYWLNLTDW